MTMTNLPTINARVATTDAYMPATESGASPTPSILITISGHTRRGTRLRCCALAWRMRLRAALVGPPRTT